MWLILPRVWQRPFPSCSKHLAEITALDPAVAGRAMNEMLGLVLRLRADRRSEISASGVIVSAAAYE